MSASNHPMGSGAASGPLPPAFASSSFPPAPGAQPPPFRPAPPLLLNNCDRLVAVARTLNARAVYQPVRRVGGEDHRPLFHASLQLVPQGYYVDGTGHSKLAARRAAAGSMLLFLQQRALIPAPPSASKPASGRSNAADDEMEDGELPPADSTVAPVDATTEQDDTAPPLFFVDRDPDPELEVVAESFKEEQHTNDVQQSPKEKNQVVKEERQSVKDELQPVKEEQKPDKVTHTHLAQVSAPAVPPNAFPAPAQPNRSLSAGPSPSQTTPLTTVSIPRSASPLHPSPSAQPPVFVPRYSTVIKPIVTPGLRSSPKPAPPPVPHSVEEVRPITLSPTIRGPQLDSELPLPRIKRRPLPTSQPATSISAAMSLNRMIHTTSQLSSPSGPPSDVANLQPARRVMLRSAAPLPSSAKVPDPRLQTKLEAKPVSGETRSPPARPTLMPNSQPTKLEEQETAQPTPRPQLTIQSVGQAQRKLSPFQPTRLQSQKPALEVKPQPAKPASPSKPGPGRVMKDLPNSTQETEPTRQVKEVVRSSGPPRKWREGLTNVDEVDSIKEGPVLRRSTRARGSAGLAVPKDLSTMKPLVIVVPPDDTEVPKRKRSSPSSPATEDGPKDATDSDIPLRKRARSIANGASQSHELPVRLRLGILCDHAVDKVRHSLHALIRANLFVELELHVFVEKLGAKQLKTGSVVKVREFPKNGEDSSLVFTRFVFEAGKICEHLWVHRAKHLAEGSSPLLSPRIIIIHENPSLSCLCKPGVVEVLKPEADLVGHVGKLLEAATKELTSL